VSTGCL